MGTAIPKTSEKKKSHYLLQLFDQRYAQQTPCRGRYTSRKMFQQIVKSLAEKENVTESLKTKDMMLWVQKMNNIRHRATEIVNTEVIFVRKNIIFILHRKKEN